jgi:hypothetical protein
LAILALDRKPLFPLADITIGSEGRRQITEKSNFMLVQMEVVQQIAQ